jgi:hypothetical protein
MALANYTDLVSAVADWLARDDLTSRIPDFITLAEAKFNRVLMHPKMESRDTLTVDTGAASPEFLTLPTGFQAMRSARLSGVTGKPRLEFMTQTQMDDYRYSIDNVSAQPVYFSIYGDEMELAPTPNEDYTVEIVYRANIPALTASNNTNWLMTLAPDLYLYGVLLEAAPYMQNDNRLSVWGTALATVIDQLNAHGERQTANSGPSTIWLPGVTP